MSPTADPHSEPTSGQPDRLSWGVLCAAWLAAAVAISPNVADPDLWGHVQYGRDLLRDGVPATATYSYTAAEHPWINHENLAEVALAVTADEAGPVGLMFGKCLLGLIVILVVTRAAWRQGAGLLVLCALPLLVAASLAHYWSARPQLASFVGFALLLALLDHCFAGWEGAWRLDRAGPRIEYSSRRMRRLWLVGPLFFVWANSHGGFAAGLCVLAAYLGLRGFEAWWREGAAAHGILRRFALMFAVALASTLLNPYSYRLHGWLLSDLAPPRPEIEEWLPPDLLSPLSLPLWLLLAVLVGSLAGTRRSRDFTHLGVLLPILAQVFAHHRHLPFLAIAIGCWLPRHLQSLLTRCGGSADRTLGQASPLVRWSMGAALAGALLLLTGRLADRLTDLRVERSEYPVAALQFVHDHRLGGNIIASFNWAQYVIAACGQAEHPPGRGESQQGAQASGSLTSGEPLRPARLRVQTDGRLRTCYPQEVVDLHFDLLLGDLGPKFRWRSPHSPPCEPARVLDERTRLGRPDLVLIGRDQPQAETTLRQQRGAWVLLYQDATAQLWGRASRFDNPSHPDYLPPEEREIGETPQSGSSTWPAFPSPTRPVPGPTRHVAHAAQEMS